MRLQVNSRKLIEGYYLGAGVASEQVADVMRVVDKIDKVSAEPSSRCSPTRSG